MTSVSPSLRIDVGLIRATREQEAFSSSSSSSSGSSKKSSLDMTPEERASAVEEATELLKKCRDFETEAKTRMSALRAEFKDGPMTDEAFREFAFRMFQLGRAVVLGQQLQSDLTMFGATDFDRAPFG